MKNTYTFLLYLGIGLFELCSNCFELDIGQISKYRKGGNEINVYKDDSDNFYKHQPYEPFLLKELYYDDEVMYFDPLLTSDQLLISASVFWVSNNPTVIYLNLQKSTIILLNENNSTLSVEAIFSGETVSNINHKFHPGSDQAVDVDLNQTKNYTSNSLNVSVNQLHLSGNGLEKFVLRYYDLGSYKLDNLKYGNDGVYGYGNLTTHVKEDAVPGNYEDKKDNFPLNVPNKEQVYGVYLYSYNGFPLMIELVYTYNKRVYFGFTYEKRYHRIFMPPLKDPSYEKQLFERLNYYACKNEFKITIDVNIKTEKEHDYYNIDNYCLGPNGVEHVLNALKIELIERQHYSCIIHKPKNGKKFFMDNLYSGNSIFELQNLPKTIDSVRVYRSKDSKPCLITIVTKNSLLYYKLEGDRWKYFNTDENLPDINNEINEKIKILLDELVPDEELNEDKVIDNKWKKEPKLSLNAEIVELLPDKVTIKVQGDETYEMPTLKYDNNQLKSKILKRFQFDIYNYMDPIEQISSVIDGDLENKIVVETKPSCALIGIYYDGRPIIEFEERDVLIHKAIYFYRKPTHNMDVYLYTNSLYVYHFRNNYYKYDYRWELVSKEPVTLADSNQTNQDLINYFNQVKRLNTATGTQKTKNIILNNEAMDLMTIYEVAILTRNYFKHKIETIMRDKSKTGPRRGIDISELNLSSYTKQSGCYSEVKFNGEILLHIDSIYNHFIKLIEYTKEDDVLNVYLYTNTLYVFRFQKKPTDNGWKFIIVQPVMCLYKRDSRALKPFFTEMNEINNFDFNVDIFEGIIGLLPNINVIITTKLNERYNITTISKNLELLKNNKIIKKDFDVHCYLHNDYTNKTIVEYLKYMNLKRKGRDEARAHVLPLYAINHIRWELDDVFKVDDKDRCVFLAVEYIHKDKHTHIYGYTNSLYVFHAYTHDDDGYNYQSWKRKKEPAVIDYLNNDDPKVCRDLKKYFKLAKNINKFDLD